MAISVAFLDELRARTTLSALIGRSIKVTKAGVKVRKDREVHYDSIPT